MPYVPQVVEVSSTEANNISNPDSTVNNEESDKPPINVSLHQETHTRLLAYKNADILNKKTFNEAVEEILDKVGIPDADEIECKYAPSMSLTDSDD